MIKLRKKKLSDGRHSLYLDIYLNGKRQYEFLKLHITKDKAQNKEILLLAENIRAKRQIEIQNSSYGFISESRKKRNLIEYMTFVEKDKKKGKHSE